MVRQFEQPRNRDLALLLDLWQPQRPDFEHLENVELAVSFVATVVADLCRKGDSNVHLVFSNGNPQCNGGPASPALLQELMEQLAVVEAQGDDRIAELVEMAVDHVEPGTEMVLVTTRHVDLSDPVRLRRLVADAANAGAMRRLRMVDASSKELGRFFQME